MNLNKDGLKHLVRFAESSVVRNLAWCYLFIFQGFTFPWLLD
jgi:hypothetical protein